MRRSCWKGTTRFTSGASSSSATLNFGGGITPAATSGTTTLTLNGANTGANTISGVLADNGAGQLAVTKSGTGVWILSAANTYSGGTTVLSGTLTTTATGSIGSGPLIVSAADTITSTLNLGASQTVSSLSGTLAGSGSASVNIVGGTTLTVSQSGNTTFAGTLVNSGTLAKTDVGTLEFNGAPTLNNNSSLQANGGTLRFNVNSGTATIGTGVTATVASGATLELAGSVSALIFWLQSRQHYQQQPTGFRRDVACERHQSAGRRDRRNRRHRGQRRQRLDGQSYHAERARDRRHGGAAHA